MIEETKDTAATVPTSPEAPEDVDVVDVAGASETGGVSAASTEAMSVSEAAETPAEATFGEADILAEPEQGEVDEAQSASVQMLEQQVASLTAKLDEQDSQYKRIAADFENFRRRTQKEKSDLELQIKCNTITELLPVIDNFERARSQLQPQGDEAVNIHKSYQSVYKNLVDCLKRIGVSPMRSEGEVFDPTLHEAVMREPTSEYEDGIIIEDLMRGYRLGDRVLRHAMVKVAAAVDPTVLPDTEPSTEAADQDEPPASAEGTD